MSQLKRLENLLSNGKITRREFISRATALGLTAAVAPAFLGKRAQAATPKMGGRFRLGVQGGNTADNGDPATFTNTFMQVYNYATRNNLVEVDHTMSPVPELAESWESTPDAAKWVFKLRKGVEFHNGKTMDANDVLWSIQRHRTEDSKSAAKALLKSIDEIKAEDKYTVAFTLKSGSADFPFLMSDYHLTICPADTTDFMKNVGTGAYKQVSFEPGVRTFAKKNPNYFKTDRGHFDELEMIHLPDANTRTTALQTGQVDAINRCEKKTFQFIEKAPALQAIITNGMKHYTFAMLCDKAPFTDNNVRMAMKYAIDREEIIKQVMRGYAVPGNDHPISPVNRYYNKNLPQRTYDPDKAKFYLKKSGLSQRDFDLSVSDEGFPGAVDAGAVYKENAKKAGIDINLVREAADGYWNDVWMKKPWCAVYWGGRPTEDWMFTTTYASGAPWNDTHWKNGHFDELLVKARAELDSDKRRAMYYEMQQIVRDDGGVIVLAFVQDLQAATKKIRYGKLAANWELDGWKCCERWWFA
ncbi:MAG: ABC transporter substrate-binding protein [Deltaproteobacteria bacterium]|nr:ABC transporter substrate-binding protein [Deltaproteobacteria bacterium]